MAVVLGFIALILALAAPAAAQDVATAERVVRDAYGGEMRAYRVVEEQRLRFAELNSTLDASALEIRFIDGTRLSLGENAAVRLDEFVYDPAQSAPLKGTVHMTKGALRFIGSKLQKAVVINTPAAALGIRGTELNVRVDGAATEIEVVSGQVSVTSGGSQSTVRQGEFVRVGAGGPVRGTPPPEFRAAFAQITQALGPSAQTARLPAPAAVATQDQGPGELAEIREGGRLLGYRRAHANGRIDVLDARRTLLGYYRPDTDMTYAANGRRLGAGDRTAALTPRR